MTASLTDIAAHLGQQAKFLRLLGELGATPAQLQGIIDNKSLRANLASYLEAGCPTVEYSKPTPKAKLAREKKVGQVIGNTITLKPGTLANAIAAGKYDSVNSDITQSRFPITADQLGEWEWKMFEGTDSDKIIAAMKAEGWESGQTGHLLAFGEKYPEVQRKNPVIGLGSVVRLFGFRRVPGLWDDYGKRRFDLGWFDSSWSSHRRFLAVRKISKT